MLKRTTLPLLILLLLSACSRQGGLDTDDAREQQWQLQQQAAGALQQWNLYARGSLRRQGELYNVGIRWQREREHRFRMFLDAPFGRGVLRIEGLGEQRFRLQLPDGRQFENSSVEALLEDVVGWSLPISGLDYWVRGLPHPGSPNRRLLNAGGQAGSIVQDGWDITYSDYFDTAQPVLPRRLQLAGDELTLKLVIERWQREQAPADTGDAGLFPSFD